MALPNIYVSLWDRRNAAGASQYNISNYVESITVRRGRNSELGRVEAGTAQIKLHNPDGRFTPGVTTGPYGSAVNIESRVVIAANQAGVWDHGLFTGFIRAVRPVWNVDGSSSVILELVDWFGLLSRYNRPVSFPSQSASNSILDVVLWAGIVDLVDVQASPSGEVLNAFSSSSSNVMSVLNYINDSAQGFMWVRRDGVFAWRHRYWRAQNNTAPKNTFSGTNTAHLNYSSLEPSFDDSFIINSVTAVNNTSSNASTIDSVSADRYGLRHVEKSNLLVPNDQLLTYAREQIIKYKDPALRFKSVTFHAHALNRWNELLALDFNDRVLVNHQPPGAAALSIDSYIEGVEHRIDMARESWEIKFQLSPRSQSVDKLWWILDVSQLDLNTYPA